VALGRHHGKPPRYLHRTYHRCSEYRSLTVYPAFVEYRQKMRQQNTVLQCDHRKGDRQQPVNGTSQYAQNLARSGTGLMRL
jgi:hypothetical protein